ncbi:MAG: hypothetical protein R6U46_12520 [Marinilabilia sp.]
MFFIGISGSLLPYLFVAGVVLVFSFKATGRSMDDVTESGELSASGHVVYSEPSTNGVSSATYFYSFENRRSCQTKPCDKKDKAKYLLLRSEPEEASGLAICAGFSGERLIRPPLFGFRFSGLSPPVAFFS